MVNADWIKQHCLFWDKDRYQNEDYQRMMGFLCTYSVSDKNKHDDAPDSFAMLAPFVANMVGNRMEIDDRFF